MTQWRHGTCTPAHTKPPAHISAHPLICPLLPRRVAKLREILHRMGEEIQVFCSPLALATLGRLLLVALPSLAGSSLPAGHRATETLAPAPALRGRHAHSPSTDTRVLPKRKPGNGNVRENLRILMEYYIPLQLQHAHSHRWIFANISLQENQGIATTEEINSFIHSNLFSGTVFRILHSHLNTSNTSFSRPFVSKKNEERGTLIYSCSRPRILRVVISILYRVIQKDCQLYFLFDKFYKMTRCTTR